MLATYPQFRCIACDELIEPGHTGFRYSDSKLSYPTVCYHCGICWELHNGRLTPDEAIAIPAVGGPSL